MSPDGLSGTSWSGGARAVGTAVPLEEGDIAVGRLGEEEVLAAQTGSTAVAAAADAAGVVADAVGDVAADTVGDVAVAAAAGTGLVQAELATAHASRLVAAVAERQPASR